MRSLAKKIQENIFRHELFPRGARIVIGVSGGPDSVCLLDILHELRKKYDLRIIVAHVNYGLRKKDSKKDEKLVKDLAEKYSLPFEITRSTQYKSTDKNLEEKLRNIRYAFFEKTRKKYKADAIAVGHNLNDQAETVLMRILRGTGLRGLGAIKFRNNRVIRPLLNIPRKEILAYSRKKKIEFRIDKTNLGTNFTRNKIRNELLPYLEKGFNLSIQEVLHNLSQSVAEDYDFINLFSQAWIKENKVLSASKLKRLHPSIQRGVLRLAIEKHGSNLREIDLAHIDEITKVVKSRKNKRQRLTFKNLKIERKGDKLTIEKL